MSLTLPLMLPAPLPSFHQPIWLLPLLLLPVLWWWLRQRDRQPIKVIFPATRLLQPFANLLPRARPPLWRRMLQLLLLANIFLALAQPFWPSRHPPIANQPTLLILNNNWLAGQHWQAMQQAAITLLDQLPDDQPIYVTSTTSLAALWPSLDGQPMAVDQAKAMVRRWQPASWPIEAGFGDSLIAQPWWHRLGQVWWLTSPMQDLASKSTLSKLEAALPMGGRLRPLVVGQQQAVITGLSPLAPLPAPDDGGAQPNTPAESDGWLVQLNSSGGKQPQLLQLLDEDGQLVAQQAVTLLGGAQTMPLLVASPQLAKATQLRLLGQRHPGAVWLLPMGTGGGGIGLIGDAGSLQSRPPLSQAAHYLTQALRPSMASMAGVNALLNGVDSGASSPAMLLWPEDQLLSGAERSALSAWVNRGGVLLRLGVSGNAHDRASVVGDDSGQVTSVNGVIDDPLLPVRLLAEPRRFGGLLSPQVQQRVQAAANSPVADLPPHDLAIQQAWLSLPDVNQSSQIWLQLSDGSPLLSARPMGQGWLLLLHVPATPNWSDLPLSALLPQLLQRLASFAIQNPAIRGQIGIAKAMMPISHDQPAIPDPGLDAGLSADKAMPATAGLKPWRQLDGYGRLVPAPVSSQPLPIGAHEAKAEQSTTVSFAHPPGYYGVAGSARPLNPDWLAAGLETVTAESWQSVPETPLTRYSLLMALGLLLLLAISDALVGVLRAQTYADELGKNGAGYKTTKRPPLLAGARQFWQRMRGGGRGFGLGLMVVVGLLAKATPLLAQPAGFAEPASLAFITGSDARTNRLCENGLSELSAVMGMRTSLTLGAPIGLDLTKPEVQAVMGRYPMVYWLVPTNDAAVTPALLQGLRRYIALGGLLVMDVGQRGSSPLPSSWADAMALPPLSVMPADHVLTRSFYLLRQLDGQPGLGDPLLLARPMAGMEVAPVMVARRQWALAWSEAALSSPQDKDAGEMALRSGINLVLYAFTGQYKADQVHMPTILQRLGQPLPVPLTDEGGNPGLQQPDGQQDMMPRLLPNLLNPGDVPIDLDQSDPNQRRGAP
ncbi:MAG: DUF4159 domain-containing protein [Alphaproteobacteria bacterium]|nr:DUF4159 domain-containing protein [Alphaproteobacteria bacterium]